MVIKLGDFAVGAEEAERTYNVLGYTGVLTVKVKVSDLDQLQVRGHIHIVTRRNAPTSRVVVIAVLCHLQDTQNDLVSIDDFTHCGVMVKRATSGRSSWRKYVASRPSTFPHGSHGTHCYRVLHTQAVHVA